MPRPLPALLRRLIGRSCPPEPGPSAPEKALMAERAERRAKQRQRDEASIRRIDELANQLRQRGDGTGD